MIDLSSKMGGHQFGKQEQLAVFINEPVINDYLKTSIS